VTNRLLRHVVAGLVALALGAGAASAAHAGTMRYRILPDRSKVAYVSGTQLGEFRGDAGAVTGEVRFDPATPPRADVAVTIQAGGLKSDNAVRDRHLHEKVLEVGRFPTIVLTAREFKAAPAANGTRGEGVLVGVLALHGVERPVSIPLRYTVENGQMQAQARFTIDLTDFALVPPSLLGLTVRKQVVVEAEFVAAGMSR
jgi:polyisoprenoid-binding protein YceI